MSYQGKIDFWTAQLADAKDVLEGRHHINNQSRYSVVRCEESLAYFTAKQETLLQRRVDSTAERITEARTRLTRQLQRGEVEFTDGHCDVMSDAVSLIEQKIVKDFLSYSHGESMWVSQEIYDAVWEAVRKVIIANA